MLCVMPSIPHEAPAELLRNNPLLARALLSVTTILAPAQVTARMADSNLSTRTSVPKELRGDAVALLQAPLWKLVTVIEPQTSAPKPWKCRSLAAYGPVAGSVHDCDAVLVIIAFDLATARACRKTIRTGHPGYDLTPFVIGPDNTPDPFDPAFGYAAPELAVLACLTGSVDLDDPGARVRVLEILARLDTERKSAYTYLVRVAASDAARRALEELMALVYRDDFIDSWRAEGLAQGRAEGMAEGRAQEAARMLLRVFAARGFQVSDEVRQRVLACADISQLEAWADRAVTAASIAAVFGD
jgi:hypothetical protein